MRLAAVKATVDHSRRSGESSSRTFPRKLFREIPMRSGRPRTASFSKPLSRERYAHKYTGQ